MRHLIRVAALSTALLSVNVVLAAESPTAGGAPATTNAPAKAAKAKTLKPTAIHHKKKKDARPSTPGASSASPATSAAKSTGK